MKRGGWLITAAFAVLLAATVYFAVRALTERPDSAYWMSRAEHEAEVAALNQRLARLDAAISERDSRIAAERQALTAAHQALSDAERKLQEAQAAEPSASPDIEAHPLVLNLREQLRLQDARYAEARSVITQQAELISTLEAQTADLRLAAELWKAQYQAERALRLSAESTLKGTELRLRRTRAIQTLEHGALIALAGYAVISIAGK